MKIPVLPTEGAHHKLIIPNSDDVLGGSLNVLSQKKRSSRKKTKNKLKKRHKKRIKTQQK